MTNDKKGNKFLSWLASTFSSVSMVGIYICGATLGGTIFILCFHIASENSNEKALVELVKTIPFQLGIVFGILALQKITIKK